MKEKKSFFDYLIHAFTIFGVTILILAVLSGLCGEEAEEVSTIFALGGRGIPTVTVFQFFLTSVLTSVLNGLFFSDKLMKRMPIWGRTVGMLITEVLMIVIFVAAFGWFPMDMWEPWLMFFVTFLVCFGVSVAVTALRERAENRKMELALNKMKEKGERINENSN